MEHATLTPLLTTNRDGRLSKGRDLFRFAIALAVGTVILPVLLGTDAPPRPPDRAVPTTVEDLSALLATSIAKFKLPGMAAAIVEGNHITAIGVAGLRCRGQAEKLTVDDLFHIGSDTKSMTATVVAMLVEEGKLRWTSSPAEILPKDGVSTIDPAWKRVTLEELLTHRAGVRANLDPAGLLLIRVLGESPRKERRDVCRAVLRKPPDKEPGKGFLYSNIGYVIAGVMAETVAGKPWEDLMRERLFRPFGMASAGFGPPGMDPPKLAKPAREKSASQQSVASQPCGHTGDGTPMPPGWAADNPASYGPAGTVHVSLGDWAKYASLHLDGERGIAVIPAGATKPLLSVASIRRLHAPFGDTIQSGDSHYAMGWGVGKIAKTGEPALIHFGSNGLWLAGIGLYPQRNVAILVVINQGGAHAQQACSELMQTLLARQAQR